MSPSPFPGIDTSAVLARGSPATLLAHIAACVAAMETHGVAISAAARLGLDERAECVDEHHARHDTAALARTLAGIGGRPRIAAANGNAAGMEV
mgnify:CR=1 FL=1